MIVSDLGAYGGTKRLIEILTATGLKELYPPQILAIKSGLLQGQDSFTHEIRETYEIPFAYFSVIRGLLLKIKISLTFVSRGV